MTESPAAYAERWRQLRPLLAELLELPPEQREARLATVDPEWAPELRELLAADQGEASERFERAIAGRAENVLAALDAPNAPRDRDLEGQQLGHWRLERLLGRGGMAEVWEARRTAGDFEQVVAIKLLKRGMDSEDIIARFLRERQILARLDHPGIARLFDGGLAPDGRPYFVLEKIEGEPITSWCQKRELPIAGRLRLLVACCGAVDAAHRQLVVHRDLKPSNILVTGAGVVKLLDFGIAKLLDDEAVGYDATRTGVRVLTPAYAAPEQILGEPISTGTDVYALGVLAYELLTGRLPHRRSRRRTGDLESAAASESFDRPSTAVLSSDSADTASTDSRSRRRLARSLAGDLDTIVLRALRREPERRYPSAAALGEDLERHLDGRPITARPDSLGYRARKFVGRHRLGVAAAVLVVLSLVGGLVASVWQARRAERQAERAERIRAFLTSVFEVSAPEVARGEEVSARHLLDEGARRVDAELANEPELRAEMLDLLAGLYRKLGVLEPARLLAERSLELRVASFGTESVEAARSEWTLGWVLAGQGEVVPARARLEHAIEVLDRIEGQHSLTAADAREPLMELAFASEGPAATLPIVEQRLATYRRVLGERDVRTALSWSDLGAVLIEMDRDDEAEAAYLRSAAVLDEILPANDPRAAYPHNNLTMFYERVERLEEAEREGRRALEIRRTSLGESHPETAQTMATFAHVLSSLGRHGEAIDLTRAAIAAMAPVDKVGALRAQASLGFLLLAAGKADEALVELDSAIPALAAIIGEDHVLVLRPRFNRANALLQLGRREDAKRELESLLPVLERQGDRSAYLGMVRAKLEELESAPES